MRILLTNDDGIYAEGMRVLLDWAVQLGEVVVAAPKVEQSGKSHGIQLGHPFEVRKIEMAHGVVGYSVDSTPADCVRFAIHGLHERFDLVMSGVNRGLNLGRDIMYSGTAGAAFEAAALDMKALAVSTQPKSFDSARKYLPEVWKYISDRRMFEKADILNVNIPHEVTGDIRLTRQGGPYYSDDFPHVGNDLYMPTGKSIHKDVKDFTLDTDATLNGFVTITPLSIERTDMSAYEALSNR